jgi:hypothetical protein
MGAPHQLDAGMLVAFVAALTGCATPAPKTIEDWHAAVVAVREQSATTFRGVNELVREAQLKRAARLPNLKESDFHPGLDAESIAVWNRALDALAEYSAALSVLLSPDLPTGVGASTKQLGTAIATSSKSELLNKQPGLASALGKLAAKLASLSAGQSAKDIMRAADGDVSEVLMQMAKMINDDSSGRETGVYQTVYANWTLQADELRLAFPARYAAVLAQRDAGAAGLLSLRRSLLELAAAHSKAAAGGSMDTSGLIASIREQVAFFKDLLTDLKPANN